MTRNWKAFGFGCGIRPFWWQVGHEEWAGTHYLNFGPLFLSWKLPTRQF